MSKPITAAELQVMLSIISKCQGSVRYIHNGAEYIYKEDVIKAMQDFASLKCKEQREICAEAVTNHADWENADKLFIDELDKTVRNAPEPERRGE